MAITEHNRQPRILIAGCGKLGGRIATELSSHSQVYGLRRNAAKVPAGVTPVSADLLDSEQVSRSVPEQLDIVIYCLTPTRYDDAGYTDAFINGLSNLLEALEGQSLKRLFFVSSSSVYSQDDDSWVDENSPTEPVKFSGQAILEGENIALASGFPATVVRFSGIYGPSRPRFLTAVMNGDMDPSSPAPFSNRIHEADATAALCHLSQLALTGQPLETCYLASDCEPVRLDEVVAWVRQQVPCKAPHPDARKGGRAGSKRCSNRRLLDSGFEFQYPDYRTGYLEMIEQLS